MNATASEALATAMQQEMQALASTRDALIQRRPISAYGMQSRPMQGGQGYLVEMQGMVVLAWSAEQQWLVDTWAMERSQALKFFAHGLHHAGERVLGVQRILVEEPDRTNANTSESTPQNASESGTPAGHFSG